MKKKLPKLFLAIILLIIGGFLIGIVLGGLLSLLGIDGQLATGIRIGVSLSVVYFAVRLVLRILHHDQGASNQATAYAQMPTPLDPRDKMASTMGTNFSLSSGAMSTQNNGSYSAKGIQTNLDVAVFLHEAKSYFIRLQVALNQDDMDDLLEMTTPKMFAEFRLVVLEEGARSYTTDVISLNAELLDFETFASGQMARVKFSGVLQESDAGQRNFHEVWKMLKPLSGDAWKLDEIE